MRATGRHMDENCRPVLVPDMMTLPPSHVCLSGGAYVRDGRCKRWPGGRWGDPFVGWLANPVLLATNETAARRACRAAVDVNVVDGNWPHHLTPNRTELLRSGSRKANRPRSTKADRAQANRFVTVKFYRVTSNPSYQHSARSTVGRADPDRVARHHRIEHEACHRSLLWRKRLVLTAWFRRAVLAGW